MCMASPLRPSDRSAECSLKAPKWEGSPPPPLPVGDAPPLSPSVHLGLQAGAGISALPPGAPMAGAPFDAEEGVRLTLSAAQVHAEGLQPLALSQRGAAGEGGKEASEALLGPALATPLVVLHARDEAGAARRTLQQEAEAGALAGGPLDSAVRWGTPATDLNAQLLQQEEPQEEGFAFRSGSEGRATKLMRMGTGGSALPVALPTAVADEGRQAAAAAGAEGEQAEADAFPAGLRVLLVDDDALCLVVLERMLRQCRYEVTTCSSAHAALALLREHPQLFDLVLSDVQMPDMDGFKLLELIGLEMDLPVIMMSSNGETDAVMKGVVHGACDFLLKPVRLAALRNIWQHVVRRFASSKAPADSPAPAGAGGAHCEASSAPTRRRIARAPAEVEAAAAAAAGGTAAAGTAGPITNMGPATSSEREENAGRRRGRSQEEGSSCMEPKAEAGAPWNEGEEEEEAVGAFYAMRKPRVVWSIDLHQKFVDAVNKLGVDKAVPKKILQLMKVKGLTRENVASHLQKYRLYLKRLSGVEPQPVPVASFHAAKGSVFGGSLQVQPPGARSVKPASLGLSAAAAAAASLVGAQGPQGGQPLLGGALGAPGLGASALHAALGAAAGARDLQAQANLLQALAGGSDADLAGLLDQAGGTVEGLMADMPDALQQLVRSTMQQHQLEQQQVQRQQQQQQQQQQQVQQDSLGQQMRLSPTGMARMARLRAASEAVSFPAPSSSTLTAAAAVAAELLGSVHPSRPAGRSAALQAPAWEARGLAAGEEGGQVAGRMQEPLRLGQDWPGVGSRAGGVGPMGGLAGDAAALANAPLGPPHSGVGLVGADVGGSSWAHLAGHSATRKAWGAHGLALPGGGAGSGVGLGGEGLQGRSAHAFRLPVELSEFPGLAQARGMGLDLAAIQQAMQQQQGQQGQPDQ